MATTTRRTRKNASTAATPAQADIEPTDTATTDTATEPTDTATTDTATTDTATEPTDTGTVDTATAPAEATTADKPTEAPVSGAPVSGAPVSGAPVSGAPVGSGDHLKVVMVAGILGDHPDGVTASAIVDESGLRAAIVGRVLAAMETAGAAVREPATTDDGEPDPNGAELWVRGEADLTTVDLTAAAAPQHRGRGTHRHGRAGSQQRRSARARQGRVAQPGPRLPRRAPRSRVHPDRDRAGTGPFVRRDRQRPRQAGHLR